MIAPWAMPKAPHNPCLLYVPGNSLTAYERQSPAYGDGRRKALSLTGSGAVRYQPASGARTNWFPNPGLASNATSWTDAGAAVGTRTADGDFRSGWCDEVVATASTSDGVNLTTGITNATLSAATLTVGIDSKLISGASDWQARAQLTDAAGTLIGSAGAFVDLVPAATVARSVLTITAPTTVGAHGVQIQIRRKTAAASTARFSTVCIEAGATNGSHVDGSVSLVAAWLDPITGYLGTAHASPSVSQAAFWPWEATTNTVPDPIFGAATITTNWTAAGAATITKVTTFAYLGAAAAEVVCAGTFEYDGITQLTTSGGAAASGQAWTINGHIRAKAAGDVGKTVVPSIDERTSANALVVGHRGPTITLTDAPQEFSFTYTLDGGGTTAKVTGAVVIGAAMVGTAVSFELLDMQLAQKAYKTPVAAGSLGTGHAWTGTAHASSSTRTATTDKGDETNHLNAQRGSLFLMYYRDVDTGAAQALFDVGDGTADKDRLTLRVNASDKFEMGWTSNGAAETTVASSGSLAVNTWYRLYAEWNGTYVAISVDGGAKVTGTRDAPRLSLVTTNDLSIGALNTGTLQANGRIGPLIANDSPLTAAEIAKLVALGPAANFTSILRVT